MTVIHDVAWLQQRHRWPGLEAIIVVDSTRKTALKTEHETRYYLTSSTLPADRLAAMVRGHWQVENNLHWVMDMTFNDDQCRIRTNNAPENFVTLKHMAMNLARRQKAKDSKRLSMRLILKTAAWSDNHLAKLIAAA